MEIFGLEKLSLVDYDGFVAATVFTARCNFRCGFCHNSALVLDYNNLSKISEEEVLAYLTKRKGILEGLCITGGEPTLNPDLPEFIKKVKDIGYSVKVDTNGTNPEMVKLLVKERLADYFAIDIKNDRASYGEIIELKNFDTKNVEKTVEFLLSGVTKYEFRTTLIAEYHKAENIKLIAEWIKGADKYFLQKFKSGDNCISQGLYPVPEKQAKEFAEIIRPFVKSVNLRGYN